MLNGNVALVSFPAQLLAFGFPHVRNETSDKRQAIRDKHMETSSKLNTIRAETHFEALRTCNNFDDKQNRQQQSEHFLVSLSDFKPFAKGNNTQSSLFAVVQQYKLPQIFGNCQKASNKRCFKRKTRLWILI